MNLEKNINILSLDGGGIRGIFSLKMLEHLAIYLYQDDGKIGTDMLLSNFDLICGTSTGSIIAAGLSMGKSIRELLKSYKSLGSSIFSGNTYLYAPYRFYRYYKTGDYYDGALLYNILLKEYSSGGSKINSIKSVNGRIKLFTVATDASTNLWKPYVFRSYEIPSPCRKNYIHHLNQTKSLIESSNDIDLPLAIRASCSAPSYFSPVQFNGKTFIDGGCVCNNPTEESIFETYKIWDDPKICNVVSIGTGKSTPKPSGTGIVNIIDEFVNYATDPEVIHERMKEMSKIGGYSYQRFNPPELGDIRLDESRPNVLENGEILTDRYMKSLTFELNKLREMLIYRKD